MVINKNLISEYLMSNEYQCSSFNLDDNIQMFDDTTTINENSIFGFSNDIETEDIKILFNSTTAKDSMEMNDEITNLFSMFNKNKD